MDNMGQPVNETRWLSDTDVRHSRAYLYWLRSRHLNEISQTTSTHAHQTDTRGTFTWPCGSSVSNSEKQFKGCVSLETELSDVGEHVNQPVPPTRRTLPKRPARLLGSRR